MSSRIGAKIAWVFSALMLTLMACVVALAIANSYDFGDLSFLIAEASAALVGALISSRQPRNPVGWFILGHVFCFTLGEFGRQYAIYGLLTEPGALPFARVLASPPYWVWSPGIILMFSLLPLYFPNGRLVSRRWRWVVWLAVFFSAVAAGLTMVQPDNTETLGVPNPLGIEGLAPFSWILGIFVPTGWLALSVASAVSLVVRFRRSRGRERQQIKWVAYAVVFLVSFGVLGQLFLQSILPGFVNSILFLVVLESVWIAVAIAILRYRLYDIDRVINRTLVYGALTAMLVLVYVGGVVLLQAIFYALTGEESQLAIVASTLVIAALFSPLRRRTQGFIDRRFYRRKYDAQKTLEAFNARLRDEVELDALSEDLLAVVRGTVQPTHASLWLRPPVKRGNRE